MGNDCICVRNATKSYGGRKVVDDLSLEYQGILHRWYLEQGQRERVAIRDPDSCEENQKVRMMSGSYSWTLFEAMRGRKFAHRVRIHGSRFLP